jgi:hypothetical protein
MLTDGMPVTPELLERFTSVVNADENPVVYLSIDPGKANGVCGYDANCYLVFMYTVKSEDMISVLQCFRKVTQCVIEDFFLYPDKAKQQVYSDMETSRVIGRVESWAERHNVELIKQGARIKPTAYAWLGQKPLPKTNKNNHKMDAHAHFIYWAVRSKRMSAAQLIKPRSVG